MPQGVMSDLSSRRGAAARQRRWRHRQRVRRQAAEALRRRLGREPTAGELREAVEAELAALGLGREATGLDEAVGGEGGEGDGDGATMPERATRAVGPAGERVFALGSVAFEARIAERQDRIFDLMMQHAEGGDASCLLFLASRLAPPARPRRVASVPEIRDLDLGTSGGVERALEAVIGKMAGGALELGDGQVLVAALERRLGVAHEVAKTEALRAAGAALAARGAGLAERVGVVRAGLEARARLIDVAPETDVVSEVVEEAG